MYQWGLANIAYRFFNKKAGSGMSVNKEVSQELYKSLTTKFKKEKSMLGLKITYCHQIVLK